MFIVEIPVVTELSTLNRPSISTSALISTLSLKVDRPVKNDSSEINVVTEASPTVKLATVETPTSDSPTFSNSINARSIFASNISASLMIASFVTYKSSAVILPKPTSRLPTMSTLSLNVATPVTCSCCAVKIPTSNCVPIPILKNSSFTVEIPVTSWLTNDVSSMFTTPTKVVIPPTYRLLSIWRLSVTVVKPNVDTPAVDWKLSVTLMLVASRNPLESRRLLTVRIPIWDCSASSCANEVTPETVRSPLTNTSPTNVVSPVNVLTPSTFNAPLFSSSPMEA